VGAWERAELLDPVRVRKEATVEDEVDVDGQAVLVPEGDDAGLDRADTVVDFEELVQAIAQFVHVEVGGVDHEVGPALRSSSNTRSAAMPSTTRSSDASGCLRRLSS